MDTQTQRLNYQPPVAQLLTLGEDAARGVEWFDYLTLGFTDKDIPELIRMALDEDLYRMESESSLVWAPLHAWRTLAQLKAEEAIEPLLGLLRYIEEADDWLIEDFPEIYAMIGPAAIPVLQKQLMDASCTEWTGATLSSTLAKMAEYHPDYRGECVAIITEKLRHHNENDPTLNGFIIASLLDLRALESVAEMEAAHVANSVDLSICGDWEDVQILLGLREERVTPKPNYALQQMGIDDPDDIIHNLRTMKTTLRRRATQKKVKKKRKQAKAQRKKQRKKRRKKK